MTVADAEPVASGSGMTFGEGARKLLRLSFPMVITECAVALIQFTDAWMISWLGSDELAALSPAGLLIFVIHSFALGFLAAMTAFVAQSFGRGTRERCGLYAWQGIWWAVAFGIGVLALWPTAPVVFGFLGHEERVFQYEVSYFQISLFSLLPAAVAASIAQFFVAIQRPSLAMIGTVFAAASNLGFNYLFIFGKFGFPRLGFAGAATGTICASIAHVVLMLILFRRCGRDRSLGIANWRPRRERLLALARIGIPSGTQNALDVVSWSVVLVWLVGLYGTAHLAAATVIIRCFHLSFLPGEGVTSALAALVGQAIGQHRHADARTLTRCGFAIVGLYMAFMALLFLLFRHEILAFFSDDPEVIAIGSACMIFAAMFQVADGMNIVYVNALRGAGDTLWPLVANLAALVGIFIVGGAIAYHRFPEFGSPAIWLVEGLYILVIGGAFALRWHRGGWERLALQ